MSTKTLGAVGRGSGWQKVGIELGSFIFYPNSSQPGMFQTFAARWYVLHLWPCASSVDAGDHGGNGGAATKF